MRSQNTENCLLQRTKTWRNNTKPPEEGASYADRQVRLRLSFCCTDREAILASHRSSRKYPALTVPSMACIGMNIALSMKILKAVWALPLSNQVDKYLLVALADYADDAGHCFPGIAALSAKTAIPQRAIYRALKRLKDTGYVEVIHRHRHSNLFKLLIPVTVAANTVCVTPQTVPQTINTVTVAVRTLKDPPSEPSKNLRAEIVINDGRKKTAGTGVIHRREPKRFQTERPVETVAERRQSRQAMCSVSAIIQRSRR